MIRQGQYNFDIQIGNVINYNYTKKPHIAVQLSSILWTKDVVPSPS